MRARAYAGVLLWASAGVLGTLAVLQLDAVLVAARSGSLGIVALAQVLGTAVGATLGVAIWAVGKVLLWVGDRLARSAARFGVDWLSPVAPLVLGATLTSTYLLAPAHRVFSMHPATTALLLAYLPFPLSLAFTLGSRLWRSGRFRVASALACALAVTGLHFANTWYYPSLYRPVHDALTGTALALATAGAAYALRDLAPRTLGVGLGLSCLCALALELLVLARAPMALRSAAFFDGTALHHTLSAVQRALDADGDGFAPGLGGDCDDTRKDVNPLRFERPGNGRDDNCRDGDRAIGGVAPSTRTSPVPTRLSSWRASHPRPNLVLVLIDTLRADFVGALGSGRGLTPELDRIAARSTLFTQARTTAPRTGPALAAVARARFHGRNLGCRSAQLAGGASLAVRLRASGYESAARMVGNSWLGTPAAEDWPGLVQRGSINEVSGPEVTQNAKALMASLARPYSLLVHYLDPHSPYQARPNIERRGTGMLAQYGAEIEATDREVGALWHALEASGRLDDSIVVIFSDHGENIGERGSRGGHHGVSVYDEDIHVLLLIHTPGVAPQRVHAPVSLVDIAPTVLELAGLPQLEGGDGRSLAGYVLGEPPPPSFSLSEYYDSPYFLRSIVDDHYKLIDDVGNHAYRLFDLRADPGELRDLAAERPERVATLRAKLDAYIETRADPSEPRPATCF